LEKTLCWGAGQSGNYISLRADPAGSVAPKEVYVWNNQAPDGEITVSGAQHGPPSGYTELAYPHPLRASEPVPSPTPAITSISPSSGTTSGGTSVTVTGTGFTGATAVKFGTTNATSYTVNSDTSITATSPSHAAQVVDITVTNSNGTSATSAADQFTFTPTPPVPVNPTYRNWLDQLSGWIAGHPPTPDP